MNTLEHSSFILQNLATDEPHRIPFFCRSTGMRTADSGFRSKLTSHEFYEFIWTVSGDGIIEEKEQTYEVSAGHIIIIPPNIKRVLYPAGELWHYRWFTVRGETFATLAAACKLPLLKPEFVGFFLNPDFIQLENCIRNSLSSNFNAAASTVFNILNKCATRGVRRISANPMINQARKLISDNLVNCELNVNSLAESLGYSRAHLARTFRRETGTTPSGFIAKQRLQLAMDVLKNCNDKISTVARRCGFFDSDYFSRFFKKHTGMSPEAFRKDDTP